jgi:hypothetical protein
VDPTIAPTGHGGETVVGIGLDLNGGRGGMSGELHYEIQVDPMAVPAAHGDEIGIGVHGNSGRSGISGDV